MEKEYLGCHVAMEKLQNLYSVSEERADTANTQVNLHFFPSLLYFYYTKT